MKFISTTDANRVEQSVLAGINEIADIVGKTLGPVGRTVIIEQENGRTLVTKDGVTVAKHHQSNDAIKNLVATAIREVCERTVREAGDGTTSAIVLTRALVREGQKFLRENPTYSPQRLARELKEVYQQEIRPRVEGMARQLRGLPVEEAKQAVEFVAMVSANHDREIATNVANATEYVGENGMVIAEEGTGSETTVDHKQGFPVLAGLASLGGAASLAFVNRTAQQDCVLEDSYVALYDGDINDINILIPLLEKVAMEQVDGIPVKHPVIVVAHGFSNQVLKIMAQNFRRGTVTCVPYITQRNGQSAGKQAFLHDLAAYVGGRVFEPQGTPLTEALPSMLGGVDRAKIGQNETVFLAEPEVETIEKRINELQDQMKEANEFECDRLRYRIGQLTGGVATIYAGGATAMEAKERHARVVDAISAVRCAMESGVVPGGGSTLAYVAHILELQGEDPARQILTKALTEPFMQILENAGFLKDKTLDFYLSATGETKEGGFRVIDAMHDKAVDWYEAGIVDPAKVTLSALENALSAASTAMTLGGVITRVRTEGEESVKAVQEGIVRALHEEVE